jgi:hypothetical protein
MQPANALNTTTAPAMEPMGLLFGLRRQYVVQHDLLNAWDEARVKQPEGSDAYCAADEGYQTAAQTIQELYGFIYNSRAETLADVAALAMACFETADVVLACDGDPEWMRSEIGKIRVGAARIALAVAGIAAVPLGQLAVADQEALLSAALESRQMPDCCVA